MIQRRELPNWLGSSPIVPWTFVARMTSSRFPPASALPTIGEGGRLYTLALRPGLVYSDGQAVKASDFLWAVERAIKLGWPGAPQLIRSRILGAEAFAIALRALPEFRVLVTRLLQPR